MKRLLSGSSGIFRRESSGSLPSTPKQRSTSSFSKRFISEDSTPNIPDLIPSEDSELSPELIPIVTLLSAHSHRRYYRGIIFILNDLKNNGNPTNKKWEEVYAVLVGTQLALWDANELTGSGNDTQEIQARLKKIASKPTYLNFTDATIRSVNSSDNFTTENGKPFENALVVSTTLKNRYFLKFSDVETFNEWNAAIRLSQYESTALQLAYTGAFLSSRGRKLGDIHVILADKKFKYSDWVSVRFGTGLPWKRCYAIISQTGSQKKDPVGYITFYENDKNVKKGNIIGTVKNATEVYSVYPSSPKLIDTSTIIKLQGTITFNGEVTEEKNSIFIMPEKHHGVPGYDTVIRFLIPTMNAFNLYGRPESLIAGRDNIRSLLFGLPTLPNVHYLDLIDVLNIITSTDPSNIATWNDHVWREEINNILLSKIREGFTGIGSERKDNSVLSSPVITPEELFRGTNNMADSPFDKSVLQTRSAPDTIKDASASDFSKTAFPTKSDNYLNVTHRNMNTSDPSNEPGYLNNNRGDYDNNSIKHKALDSEFANDHFPDARKSEVGLGAIYDKYAVLPSDRTSKDRSPSEAIFGNLKNKNVSIQSQEIDSPYEKYLGSNTESKRFEISNIRDSSSSANSNIDGNSYESAQSLENVHERAMDEFNDLAQKINSIGMTSLHSEKTRTKKIVGDMADIAADLNFDTSHDESVNSTSQEYHGGDDVDLDYVEQKEIFSSGNPYSTSSSSLNKGSDSVLDSKDPSNRKNNGQRFPHSTGTTNLSNYTNHRLHGYQDSLNNSGLPNPYDNPNNSGSNNNLQNNNRPGNTSNEPNYNNNSYPHQAPQNRAVQNSFDQEQHIRTGPMQPHNNMGGMNMNQQHIPNYGNPYQQNSAQNGQYPQQMNRYIQHPHQGQTNMNGNRQHQKMQQRVNTPNPMYKNPQFSNSGNSLNSKNDNRSGARGGGGFSQFMPKKTTSKNPYSH